MFTNTFFASSLDMVSWLINLFNSAFMACTILWCSFVYSFRYSFLTLIYRVTSVVLRCVQPVVQNLFSLWREYRFRVVLHTTYIVLYMPKRHHLSISIIGGRD